MLHPSCRADLLHQEHMHHPWFWMVEFGFIYSLRVKVWGLFMIAHSRKHDLYLAHEERLVTQTTTYLILPHYNTRMPGKTPEGHDTLKIH